MEKNDWTGKKIPRFTYDTPTHPQVDFYKLCEDERPLVMVFLPAYNHPVSRVYLQSYIATLSDLKAARLACVVHSSPRTVSEKRRGEYPFPLICDAKGALYQYLKIGTTTERLNWSFASAPLFREAKKLGYVFEGEQQLPLTLIVGREGLVLYCHYGTSIIDLPGDCGTVDSLVSRLNEEQPAEEVAPEDIPTDDALDAALQAGNAAEELPEQSAPDYDDENTRVVFPGRVKEAAAKKAADDDFSTDLRMDSDNTTQIDLGKWLGGAQSETVEVQLDVPDEQEEQARAESAASAADKKKWGKLLGLFSKGSNN